MSDICPKKLILNALLNYAGNLTRNIPLLLIVLISYCISYKSVRMS